MRNTAANSASPTETERHITVNGHGESFDTTFNDEHARHGEIAPHTHVIDFSYISRKASESVVQDVAQRLQELCARGIGDIAWWDLTRSDKFEKLSRVVGDTRMEAIEAGLGVIYSKCEYDNPSGSHYDRAYLKTIQHFEEIGFIQPGDELRDITSGSAGISLSLMSYLLGYKSRITIPSELPANRIYPMLALGSTVINAGEGYVPHSSEFQVAEINQFREDPRWEESRPADRSGRALLFDNGDDRICYLNHSENELSPQAFGAIAREIIVQAPDTTHLVLAEGNWTTIYGIARYLKTRASQIKIIGYSGDVNNGSTENYGTNVPDVPIRFKDTSLLDEDVMVSNAQRDSMQSTAPHLGRSSLMGLWVAKAIADVDASAKIVTIGYDLANRY